MASTLPRCRPGSAALSTSATTAMRISEADTPISVAAGFAAAASTPAGSATTSSPRATTTTTTTRTITTLSLRPLRSIRIIRPSDGGTDPTLSACYWPAGPGRPVESIAPGDGVDAGTGGGGRTGGDVRGMEFERG